MDDAFFVVNEAFGFVCGNIDGTDFLVFWICE